MLKESDKWVVAMVGMPDGLRLIWRAVHAMVIHALDVPAATTTPWSTGHGLDAGLAAVADGSAGIVVSRQKGKATVRWCHQSSGSVRRVVRFEGLLGGRGMGSIPVAVGPDGRWGFSTCNDHHVRVVDMESREVSRVLKGHRTPVETLAVSPDGRRVVSGGEDGVPRVWELDWECPGSSFLAQGLGFGPDRRSDDGEAIEEDH